MTTFDEPRRQAELRAAQGEAQALFAAIAAEGLVRPGVTEAGLSEEIHALAAARFGVEAHWHKRVVRAGANTLATYHRDPPDLTLQADDIAFVDLGPVFGAWEADYGRTFVLGDDPAKHRLAADLDAVWAELKVFHDADPGMTGERLYAEAHAAAERRGWRFAGEIAGHLVGEFPHTAFPGERNVSLIAPGNDLAMDAKDADGRVRHWILEVHLAEPQGRWAGFVEGLLG